MFPAEKMFRVLLFVCLFSNKSLFWFEIQQKHTLYSVHLYLGFSKLLVFQSLLK